MKCRIEIGKNEWATTSGTPICGKDFCDNCSDCLDCQCASGFYPCSSPLWNVYYFYEWDTTRQNEFLKSRNINLKNNERG